VPKDISRIIIIDQNLTEEEAFSLEVKMIAGYGRVDNNTGILRNRTDGGEGASGAIHTDATKLKISKVRKGKTFSDAHKLQMSKAQKGKTHTDATKLQMSKVRKGKTHTDATKLLMSKANKGRIFITDGINSRTIHSTDPIPLGWRKGRSHASGSDIYAFLDGTS
jgi:tRNA-binding EMAP/Myf-like protein